VEIRPFNFSPPSLGPGNEVKQTPHQQQ